MRIVGDKFIRERIEELKKIKESEKDLNHCKEENHVRADAILCEVLERAGLEELVEAYYEIYKYYI